MSDGKVAVIGLDGACFKILGRYCDMGLMPNLKSFIEEGVSADLISTFPPLTGPAWASFMTGKDPSNTGIADWMSLKEFRWDKGGVVRKKQFINSGIVQQKTVWEILTEHGKKSIVLNVPLTYPVRPVNGVVVSGFLTPSEDCEYTHPAEVKEEIKNLLGKYQINISHPSYAKSADGVASFFKDLTEMTSKRTELALHFLETREWDFFMLVYIGIDRTQHMLWEYVSGVGGPVPGAEKMVHDYYRFLDGCIGRLLDKLGSGTPAFFVSDHGFTQNKGYFQMNRWLMDEGLIGSLDSQSRALLNRSRFSGFFRDKLKPTVLRILNKTGMMSLKGKLGRVMRAEDMIADALMGAPDSKAALLMPFTLKIKRYDDPGEFERVRDDIIDRMRKLVDETTGLPLFDMVERSEDVYGGSRIAEMSDIIFLFSKCQYVATADMPASADKGLFMPPEPCHTGTHDMEGIFIARGDGIRKGLTLPALHIEDAAPTVLYRMGLEVPEDMDGKVAAGIFEDGFVNSHALVRSGASGLDVEGGLDEEEDEKVRESLESLGYL